MERLIDFGVNLGTAVVGAVAAGVAWLVRRVLTNEAEIALLKQHLKSRDELRDEDREALGDVRESVKRIESWIMERGK
jgi:hypothetical protein